MTTHEQCMEYNFGALLSLVIHNICKFKTF